MSKKDYIKFAELINKRWNLYKEEYYPEDRIPAERLETEICKIASEMSKLFEADNPNFNRSKFLIACGLS